MLMLLVASYKGKYLLLRLIFLSLSLWISTKAFFFLSAFLWKEAILEKSIIYKRMPISCINPLGKTVLIGNTWLDDKFD